MSDASVILVTGGTGFVGRRLIGRLAASGERVRALVRRTSDVSVFANGPVELAYGDVTDRPSVHEAMRGCTHVYHLAKPSDWLTPDTALHHRVNVDGTRNVMEEALAAGVEKVVYTGSYLTLFQEGGLGVNANHRGNWIGAYNQSKRLGEQEALSMNGRGLPVVSVLPTAIYGPGDTSDAGRILVLYLRRRLLAQLEIRANMVYVDDVVDGHIAAMQRGRPGKRYVLGGDNSSSCQIVEMLAEMEGRRYIPPRLPFWIWPAVGLACELWAALRGSQPLIDRDFVHYFAQPLYVDSDAPRRELGFSYTPLREGLQRYVTWLRETGHL